MEIEEFFTDEYQAFIQELVTKQEYFVIRENAEYLLGLEEREFAYEFDYAMAKSNIFPLDVIDPITGEEIKDAIEYVFLHYLYYKITRAHFIIEDYTEHCENINKKVSEELEEYYETNSFKGQFVHLKLKRVTSEKEVTTLKKNIKNLQKPIKKTAKATVEGKTLNNSERFQIVNQSLGLWEIIDSKEISQLKKYKLLALTLGINEDNARKLVLNNYDSKDRPQLIEKYLKQLE